MDVLLLTEDQQVTSRKTLASFHVLQTDSFDIGARRRRWSLGICGSRKVWTAKNPKYRSEAVLMALRGVAAAQDLLDFLVEAPQGLLFVPEKHTSFFKLLTHNPACAISSLEDDCCLKLPNILHDVEWINGTAQGAFSRVTIMVMINNVKEYIHKEKMELGKVILSIDDLLMIHEVSRQDALTRQDVLILNSLVSLARNHEVHYLPPDVLLTNCMLVCPEIREAVPSRKKLQKTCAPDISPVFKSLNSMSLLSSIIRSVWHLPTHHLEILEASVIRYFLVRLLQTVRGKKHLRTQIWAAEVCAISPEGGKESFGLLIKYRRELYREAVALLAPRTKRDAPISGKRNFL